MLLRGGEILAKCLKTYGVEYVFGLPGHGNIGLIDGFVKEEIPYIMFHHETIAGMAADGYYRATRRPGVVCLTCTPGALNAQIAIATAAHDCSAVLYIVGDIPTEFAGKTCYEELDSNLPDGQFQALVPMFKRSWKVYRLELLPQYVANALNTALSGRPGPVLIDIPFDLHKAKAEIPEEELDIKSRVPMSRTQGDPEQLRRAAELLTKAEKPIIYAGGGVKISGASEEVERLSEMLRMPIVTSIAGAGSVPESYPNVVGFIGSYGRSYANRLVKGADVILAIGSKFEEEETAMWSGETFNIPPSRLIQIDVHPPEIGKNYPVEVGVVGDAKRTLQALIEILSCDFGGEIERRKTLKPEWISLVEEEKKTWMERLRTEMESDEAPLNPKRVLKALERHFPENGILIADPSWARIGLLQQFEMPGPDRCYIVGGALPIGWSTAAALGIALGRPEARVVAVTGDGGFLLNVQSVATAVEYGIPVVWIILNNYSYNAIAVLQRAYFGGRSTGGDFILGETGEPYTPDYVKIADAFGAEGLVVDEPNKIDDALNRAFQSCKPFVLDFRVSKTGSRLYRTGPVTWEYYWSKDRE
ncbi:thiamine pyrophosphate-binding protein [Candidatus Bathyarchaeota archaeon]|nr:thiamine pyrophosphate-binding protein [Candidatus Bathyarchaeota archaeon]MBS7630597.1 thiamine pyrophosphate-binding protein [Candidatus Bathyarchaeota archaeon]